MRLSDEKIESFSDSINKKSENSYQRKRLMDVIVFNFKLEGENNENYKINLLDLSDSILIFLPLIIANLE